MPIQSPRLGFALCVLLACIAPPVPAEELPADGFTVLSWNAEGTFETMRQEFQAVLQFAKPHIVLLDEAPATTTPLQVHLALEVLDVSLGGAWQVDVGESGGRQRNVVASIAPIQTLPEFSTVVPYPDTERRRILAAVPRETRDRVEASMDAGIPVNGVIVHDGDRRLLLVITDLMCCGDGPQSWEELRRRVEAKAIRQLVRQVLAREMVDGLIIAGDFNLVATALPLVMLSGPYPAPSPGLIGAELYHLDGRTTWTWDGRGTPFPSRALDYQLYGPNALEIRSGYVFDSEDLPFEALQAAGLAPDSSRRLSSHRPLVVTYRWRQASP